MIFCIWIKKNGVSQNFGIDIPVYLKILQYPIMSHRIFWGICFMRNWYPPYTSFMSVWHRQSKETDIEVFIY